MTKEGLAPSRFPISIRHQIVIKLTSSSADRDNASYMPDYSSFLLFCFLIILPILKLQNYEFKVDMNIFVGLGAY